MGFIKNSKKKIDKKSGRKQPRANDYDVQQFQIFLVI
jgi:hypothetical protein